MNHNTAVGRQRDIGGTSQSADSWVAAFVIIKSCKRTVFFLVGKFSWQTERDFSL